MQQQPPPGVATMPPPNVAQQPALLAPLYGAAMEQAELRAIVAEIITNLPPDLRSRVRGVPIVLDPDPSPNAYAACDDSGAPFLAATQGIFDAIDAISQTQATDEIFGTQTYEAYAAAVMPRLVTQNPVPGGAALDGGIIPAQYWSDARRFSRAREIFDETVAFTFGHELAHHYLGHTGCANGQAMTAGPSIAQLGQIATQILPGLNQPNEVAADNRGVITTLDSGLARQRNNLYRWTERGAYRLLDFFARMEKQAGIEVWNPVGFLRSHPYPTLRLPLVQVAAQTWHQQHGS
jgi:hypothetical protein